MAAQGLAHIARLSLARSPALFVSLTQAHPSLLCKRAAGSFVSRSSERQVELVDLPQLCEKARLSLTPEEIADFTPKISSVLGWFAQLQDVDVENVAPAIRIGEEDDPEYRAYTRVDLPMTFEDREAMLAATPEREGVYLKVPKILKENLA